MNTIKKYFMVIAVAAVAISASAYKSIETVKAKVEEGAFAPVTFYHMGGLDNKYTVIPPSSSLACEKTSELPCTIKYDENDVLDLTEFKYLSRPTALSEDPSDEEGIWQ